MKKTAKKSSKKTATKPSKSLKLTPVPGKERDARPTAKKNKPTPAQSKQSIEKKKEVSAADLQLLAMFVGGATLEDCMAKSEGRYTTPAQMRYRLFVAAGINPSTPAGRQQWHELCEKRPGKRHTLTAEDRAKGRTTLTQQMDDSDVPVISNGETKHSQGATIDGHELLRLTDGRTFAVAKPTEKAIAIFKPATKGLPTLRLVAADASQIEKLSKLLAAVQTASTVVAVNAVPKSEQIARSPKGTTKKPTRGLSLTPSKKSQKK